MAGAHNHSVNLFEKLKNIVEYCFFIVQMSTLITLLTALLGKHHLTLSPLLRVGLSAPIGWVGIIDKCVVATEHPVYHIANPKEYDEHCPEMPVIRRV
jgi:hypothetical protein